MCKGGTSAAAHAQGAFLLRDFQPCTTCQPHCRSVINPLPLCHQPSASLLSCCSYELHHGVKISDSALVEAAVLSDRYIADRFLPGGCYWEGALRGRSQRLLHGCYVGAGGAALCGGLPPIRGVLCGTSSSQHRNMPMHAESPVSRVILGSCCAVLPSLAHTSRRQGD